MTLGFELIYENGTLLLEGVAGGNLPGELGGFVFDERTCQWRAPAHLYRDIILAAKRAGLPLLDKARAYQKLPLKFVKPIVPRDHQARALKAWVEGDRCGVVQLPTGAGKTFLALLAMVHTARSTLVIVPTIDLLHQWHEILKNFLGIDVGVLGGGSREFRPVMIATYDSAVIHADSLGNQFGLLIVDECHHLPAPQYQLIALGSLAPFRLGLSATVARADGRETEIFSMLGPLLYEGVIGDMVADVLAPYDVVSLEVPMTSEEEAAYLEARSIYTGFVRRYGINFSTPAGWTDFLRKTARLPGGKGAMRAYREQKRLAQASSAKMDVIWRLLGEHSGQKTIIFTNDNDMAYRIGKDFVLPVITHQTKLAERKQLLASFREGELSVLVTSKVLNEGVDVPDASVGIVVSGSGAVREHVQRLGRILRHKPGKRARLYEIVSKGTGELYVNQRRRQHHAYQGPSEVSS